MPSTLKQVPGSGTTIFTTELNSLANNSQALSAVFDNSPNAAGDGATEVMVTLTCNFGTAPTASTGCAIWFLQTIDGTTYEDGSAGVSGSNVTPARPADLVIAVRAATGTQVLTRQVMLPAGPLKVLLRNDGTAQAMAASGNTLVIKPVPLQVA